jgi:hypothetical protein
MKSISPGGSPFFFDALKLPAGFVSDVGVFGKPGGPFRGTESVVNGTKLSPVEA